MRTALRYSASDCFDTFPFPAVEALAPTGDLEAIGTRLYETRARLMAERNQGLTTTYNQLKDPACDDPDILALRRLHEDLDRAVLAAYAWPDIPVPAYETPTTPAARAAQEAFEDEIIDRLFATTFGVGAGTSSSLPMFSTMTLHASCAPPSSKTSNSERATSSVSNPWQKPPSWRSRRRALVWRI